MLVVAAVVGHLGGEPSKLDVPIEGRLLIANPAAQDVCASWLSIAQLAYGAQLRVGFQSAPDCRPYGYGAGRDFVEHPLDLEGMTPRSALNRFVELRPEYSWKVVGMVAVIRPVAAWTSADVLDWPVAPFAVHGVHPHHALHAMVQSARPTLFIDHTAIALSSLSRRIFVDPHATGEIDRPISVAFRGGTFLDALNAVAEPLVGVSSVGYLDNVMHVTLQSLKERDGLTSIAVPAVRVH